jgi:hypothetical protein
MTRQSIENKAFFEVRWMPGVKPGHDVCSSFRGGPKDQTPDAQLRIGESRDPGSMLRIAPE